MELLKKARKAGYLYMRQGLLGQFGKYLAVISGDYLYLFNSPQDIQPLDYYYIRDSTMEYTEIVNGLYVFLIRNQYTEVHVAWAKQS